MPMALPKQPQKLLLGALAGIIATVPMTFVMTIWHRRLPWWQRYPLPPRIITDRLLTRAPLPSGLVPPPSPGRALAAHFAFGAAAGSIYECLSPALRHRYPLQAGVLCPRDLGWQLFGLGAGYWRDGSGHPPTDGSDGDDDCRTYCLGRNARIDDALVVHTGKT